MRCSNVTSREVSEWTRVTVGEALATREDKEPSRSVASCLNNQALRRRLLS